jgi:hypothetical protein
MYFRNIETDREAKEAHDRHQKSLAQDRRDKRRAWNAIHKPKKAKARYVADSTPAAA